MTNPKKRRTEITIETHQLTIIRARHKSFFFDCRVCRLETVSLVPAQAAAAFGLSESMLENLCLNNLIHQSDDGGYCGNSLARHFRTRNRFVED